MSDYERHKCVAYKVTDEDAEKFGLEDLVDLDWHSPFKDKFCPTYAYDKETNEDKIQLECMDNFYLICKHIYYTYDDDCAEFGRSRYLTETEQEKYKKYFEWIPDFDPKKLKFLDYSFYNCCEPDDYWSERPDDFYNEI